MLKAMDHCPHLQIENKKSDAVVAHLWAGGGKRVALVPGVVGKPDIGAAK